MRLAEEFRSPPPVYIEPPIRIERQDHSFDHILVVWQDWAEMTTAERSQIIVNAYQQARGLDAALKITFAMGLTDLEKQRMGIMFQPLEAAVA